MASAERHLRLFFAAWPDAKWRERLRAIQDGLADLGGRPTHPRDLHLTLQFLGSVEQSRLEEIKAAVADVRMAPFELHLDGLEYWRRPRILALVARQVPDALAAFVSELQGRMTPLGFPPDARPYRPHVTLVRKLSRASNANDQDRHVPASDDGPRLTPPPLHFSPIIWPIDSFHLAESTGESEPPRYRLV